ncbi:MAG: leucine-rich repeat protein [Spirochaetaceae bacterium]|nr:leucine-rich repeat protein [Spirochaetaceae bacterium]
MKKKFLTFILCICFIIPAMFCLSACTQTLPDIQFKVEDGYIQYYDGESWNDLIAIESLKGLPGDDGEDADVWTMGQNGNWFKNGQDTGKQAVATNGQPGNGIKSITKDDINSTKQKTIYIIELDNGTKYSFEVINGLDGSDGEDAETPTISISEDGYWIINGEETDKKAIGADGSAGKDADIWTIGENGNWFKNGQDTGNQAVATDGENGKDGTDGISYYVHIKYADEKPTSTTTLKTTPSAWMGVYTGTSKTAPSSYSQYTWYCIKGTDGEDGKDTSYATYTISYDYGSAEYLFGRPIGVLQNIQTEIKSTEWITIMPEIKQEYNEYSDAFLGWFIKDSNKRIDKYDFIGGNVVLEARFDYQKLGLAGFYDNGKFVSWEDISSVYEVTNFIEGNTLKSFPIYKKGQLVIDDSITAIADEAFSSCKITAIKIPESVNSIGRETFAGCTLLTTINLPNNISTISEYMFGNCTSLKEIDLTNIVTIEDNAFYKCESLTNINWSKDLTTIGEYAFNDCVSLETINLPSKVESLGAMAFSGCEGLKSIELPDSLISIGQHAFSGCKSLAEIQIPQNVTTLDIGLFYNCSNLKEVTITGEINTIKKWAFSSCASLAFIVIPDSVTTIEEDVFENCDNLTTITFEEKDGYKWQVYDNNSWRDAEPSELFNLAKEGKELKRVAE